MTTDAAYQEVEEIQAAAAPKVAKIDKTPEYKYRAMFRDVLMDYFAQTTGRSGSYLWAEQMAKEYFLNTYGIEIDAWDYRDRTRRIYKGH